MTSWLDSRSPTEYFKSEVESALEHQKVSASEDASFYLVNLLASRIRSGPTQGPQTESEEEPLAVRLLAAMSHPGLSEQICAMREVGDFALFMSGIFSDRLVRSSVDIAYYIGIGSNAYTWLSQAHPGRLYPSLFQELAARFTPFVDVLSEVSEHAQLSNNQNLLALYEFWLSTGSRRREGRLLRMGLAPRRAPGEG
ncbi:MAG: hypothetical protein HYX75_23080 [Acidobacteria bacterium]|nr:hypothetical protein [Acidobacteriota bacterium]